MAWTGLGSTSQKNIWCYLINKTLAQMNDERAGWRAHLKRRARVFKENQKRLQALDKREHEIKKTDQKN